MNAAAFPSARRADDCKSKVTAYQKADESVKTWTRIDVSAIDCSKWPSQLKITTKSFGIYAYGKFLPIPAPTIMGNGSMADSSTFAGYVIVNFTSDKADYVNYTTSNGTAPTCTAVGKPDPSIVLTSSSQVRSRSCSRSRSRYLYSTSQRSTCRLSTDTLPLTLSESRSQSL